MSFQILTYGDPEADTLLLQMVDDHDMEGMDREIAKIREMTGGKNFCLKAVPVNSWNKDLSPWNAPAVFGKEDFGDGAPETLDFLLREAVPAKSNAGARAEADAADAVARAEADAADAGSPASSGAAGPKQVFLGGYSLAALFALWAGYQTDRFDGIAAASPSMWFPGFLDYMRAKPMQAEAVYLSLGDKEEKTRNPVMAQVGTAIRNGYECLKNAGVSCVLEWNPGNHFRDADLRTAKAFAWLMNRKQSEAAE